MEHNQSEHRNAAQSLPVSHAVLFFDGVCNLCNKSVDFIIRRDKNRVFRFASLQSPLGQQILREAGLPAGKLESIVLLNDGKHFTRSSAALHVFRKLPFPWPLLATAFIIPRFIRDRLYTLIANRRYRWFGTRDSCRVPTAEERKLFLD